MGFPTATRQRGSATVEQIGVVFMVAAIFAVLAAAYLTGAADKPGHGLGIRIANRIACGPREPGVCRQHPAVSAYGQDLARVVRWLAPEPFARIGPDGRLLAPVDFRYCQQPGCALPAGDGRLTTSNRRLTLFTEVAATGQSDPGWRITYWFYRPSLGWDRVVRLAGAGRGRGCVRNPRAAAGQPPAGAARDPSRQKSLPVTRRRRTTLALEDQDQPHRLVRLTVTR